MARSMNKHALALIGQILLSLMIAVGLLGLQPAAPVQAALTPGSADGGFHAGTGANAAVQAVAYHSDGSVIIGGSFTSVAGTARVRIARLTAEGALDAAFAPGSGANGDVLAVVALPDGKVIIAGSFTTVNGTARARVARLNADGSLDTSFTPGSGANGAVRAALLQPDGKIIIAGSFTSYGGSAAPRIARLNSDGSLDTTFTPGSGPNGDVNALALQSDGQVVLGGLFTDVNGSARGGVARLSTAGSLDAGFAASGGANGPVFALALESGGSLWIGGEFTAVDGTPRVRVAHLTASGTLDAGFDAGGGPDATVYALSVHPDGGVVAAGTFTSVNGSPRGHIAHFDAAGGFDPAYLGDGGANGAIYALAAQPDGRLLLGGDFTLLNGMGHNRIARLNRDGSLNRKLNPASGANGNVATLALQPDGRIMIGGDFTDNNGVTRPRIARLNPDGTVDQTFNPGSGADNRVNIITLQPDGKILIGGLFTSYNGTSINRIARLNPDGSLDASFNVGSGADALLYSVVLLSDGKILIGGDFNSYNGTARGKVARLNSDGTLDTGFNPSPAPNNSVVTILPLSDGDVLVGGVFFNIGGRLARLNSDGSLDTGFNTGTGANGTVYGLYLTTTNQILVTGSFTSINSTTANYIARLDLTGALDATFTPGAGANGTIYTALVQPDGGILIGGDFTTYDSTTRNRVARLTANGALDTSFDPLTGASVRVNTLGLQSDGKILLGGNFTFTQIGVNPRVRVARLHPSGLLDVSFQYIPGANGRINQMVLQPNGKIILVGAFTGVNDTARSRVARLNGDGSLDTSFDPGSGAGAVVYAAALQSDGKIVIGGSFTSYNGTSINRIARLNPDGSLDGTFNPGSGINDWIWTILIQPDQKIVIAGAFVTYNGTTRNRIARLNTDGSLDATFNPGTGPNNSIWGADFQANGKIIIAGTFTTVSGTTRGRVARLNTDGSLDASFDPGTGATGVDMIYAVAVQSDDSVVIGGNFTAINSTPLNRVARLSANGALDTAFNPGTGVDNTIWRIKYLSDGSVLIGGGFTTFNGTARSGAARLNGDGSLMTSFDIGTGASGTANTVYDFGVDPGGKLVLVGEFTGFNGLPRARLVRLNGSTAPAITSGVPASGTYASLYSHTFSAVAFPAATFQVTGSLPPGLTLNPVTGVLSGTATRGGSYNFTLVAGNGAAPNATQAVTLTINGVPLTVTAENKTRAYGAANPTFTATFDGLVNGDTPASLGTLTFSGTGPATTASSPVGSAYTIIPGGLTTPNYAITYNNGSLSITQAALTVTADNKTRAYGAANPTFTASFDGLVAGDTPASLGTLTFSGTGPATTASSPVGSAYTIIPGGLSTGNYTITYHNGSLSITQAALTVTADNKSRPYGGSNPAFTVSYTGFVNSETESALGGALTISGSATTTDAFSPAGDYVITPGGLTSSNYAITFTGGTLTISKVVLTVTADNAGRVYGAADPTFHAVITGFVNAETESVLGGTLTLTTGTTASSPVGTYSVTPGGLTADNYSFNYVAGVFEITPAETALVISATAPRPAVIDQPTTVFITLSITPPGGGSPTGTITVTDGTETCTITLPETSCQLTFHSKGYTSLTASYSGDHNFFNSATLEALAVFVRDRFMYHLPFLR